MNKTLVLKLILSLGLLGFLLYRFPISKETLTTQWQNLNWGWVIFTFIAASLANGVGFFRWYLLLKTQGITLPFKHVLAISWISLFFSNFSIGILGGDMARVIYLLKLFPSHKSKAIFSIFLDRIIGFMGLCLIALLIFPLNWEQLENVTGLQTLVKSLLILLFLGLAGLFSFTFLRKKGLGLFFLLEKNAWCKKILAPFDEATTLFFQQKKTLLVGCLGLSAGVHFFLILCGYGLAQAFSLPISFYLMACFMPLINVAITLPVTISGLGVREALILFLFQSSYLPIDKALLFSLSYWLVGLVIAAGGGIFYIFYRCSYSPNTNNINI